MITDEPHPSDFRPDCLHFLVMVVILFFFFHHREEEKAAEYENV